MTNCSIKQCRSRKSENKQLTIHRFPKRENMRKKWLDAIALKNINTNHKNWHVCSLHFEDKCFNRTLDVIRLREDAVPSLLLPLQGSDDRSNTPVLQDNTNTQESLHFIQLMKNVTSVSEEEIVMPQNVTDPLAQKDSSEIKKLKEKCEVQKKVINKLKEKVRRRDKRIATLTQLLGDLQKKKDINTK